MTRLAGFILIGCALTVIGCDAQARFTYPNPGSTPYKAYTHSDYSLNVLPFADRRTGSNSNTIGLFLIPALPATPAIHYERPESASPFVTMDSFAWNPAEDIGKATVWELQGSGLFKSVTYGKEGTTDFALHGEVVATVVNETMYPYFASFGGSALWLIGFPEGSAENWLEVRLKLLDREGREVWHYSIEQRYGVSFGLYYNRATDCDGFSVLLENGLKYASRELDRFLETYKGRSSPKKKA